MRRRHSRHNGGHSGGHSGGRDGSHKSGTGSRKRRYDGPPRHLIRGAVAGLVGGLVASWTMNQFQSALRTVGEQVASDERDDSRRPAQAQTEAESEPATTRAAEKLVKPAIGRELTRREKSIAEPAVHYLFGSLMGGLYGALMGRTRQLSLAKSLGFGVGLWFVADEIGVPAAGLGPKPTQAPLSSHVSALASHIVYGMTVEGVRRVLAVHARHVGNLS